MSSPGAEAWRDVVDTGSRDLRRMVVSPLDPPLARVTGETEAVPGPAPHRPARPNRPSGPSLPPARPRTAYPPPTGPPVDLPPPPGRAPLQGGVVVEPATRPVPRRRPPHAPRPGNRWLSRGAALTGLLLALGFAWLVLVTLRQPQPAGAPADQIGARIDETLVGSLLADRAQSVLEWIANVTTTLVLGGVIFRLFVLGRGSPERAGSTAVRTLRRAAAVGMVAELTTVFVRAVAVSGTGLEAASDPRMLRFVVAGRFGSAALVRVAGLAILAGLSLPIDLRPRSAVTARFWAPEVVGRQPAPASKSVNGNGSAGNGKGTPSPAPSDRLGLERLSCVVGGVVVLLSFALVGHPQATGPTAMLAVVQCAHVLAVSTWFGGVTFLAIELRQQRRDGSARVSAEVVARFSTVATITVVLAAGTGLVLANSQLDSLDALLSTDYGHALIVKLSALSVPLAIGGYNRQWLVPAIVKRDEPAAWRHLRQALVMEVLFIALGVLLATAAMTSGGF